MQGHPITRRRLLAGLSAVGLGAIVAACTPSTPAPEQKPAESKPAESKPTAKPAESKPAESKPAPAAETKPGAKIGGKVRWLVRSTPQENKGQEEVFEPLIKEQVAGVEIERIVVPGAQYIPKINSMAAAKESLEIWGFGGNYYDYWVRGLPQDLTGYITADKWDVNNYFQPGLMDVYKVKGKYYGLAQLTTYGSVMVYNKNLFDEAGVPYPPVRWDDKEWTFDKVLEIATKMTKNAGKPDAQYGVRLALWAGMTAYPYLWGGDAWLPEHYTNLIAPKTNFLSDAVIESHQYRQDLIWKHKVHPDPAADQGLSQLGPPFKTGKIAMDLDGGWLFWTTSDIKDFKIGYAALPMAKSNKHINFTDFWIMGRWSENKDAAWQVMRVLTNVDATTKYAVHSGTPPTVRESLKPWLERVSQHTGQSIDDLVTLTTGAVDPKIAQESPDHIFVQHPKIWDTYNQEDDAIWNNQGSAKDLLTNQIAKTMDEVVNGIYNQFKDAIPKE